jgi:hypothetical protein
VAEELMNTHRRSYSTDIEQAERSVLAWQNRVRDAGLTTLLVLELCAIFVAGPLAAKGVPFALPATNTIVVSVLVIIVMLSQQWGAIILVAVGLIATGASFLLNGHSSWALTMVLRRGGEMLAFLALVWVVAHAVYAPGRITYRRLQGAAVFI